MVNWFVIKNRLNNSILDAARRVEANTFSIGAVGAIGFLLYYPLWVYILPQSYDSLSLRLMGAIFCLVIMLKDMWPSHFQRHFPWVWYGSILYALPFFFTFMLLMNNLSHVWTLSLLIALFLLILLVDLFSLVVLWSVGSALAFVCFLLTERQLELSISFIEDALLFPFAIVAGTVFRYQIDRETKEKLHGILAAGGSIAHELRTPLLGIKAGISGLRRYLPDIFEGYTKAVENQLVERKIRRAHLQALYPILDRIEEEADFSNVIIDMLLTNAGKKEIDSELFEYFSVKEVVDETLKRYPFGSEREKNIVHWDQSVDDFNVWGSDKLMVHVLFNLLKNALYFITQAEKGEISIFTKKTEQYGILYFRDTGTGIPANRLPHIFERFYSSTDVGTGIGLSFCKRVIESFGGSIHCDSQEGQYTEFVIQFPIGVKA